VTAAAPSRSGLGKPGKSAAAARRVIPSDSVSTLELRKRAREALRKLRITTIAELTRKTRAQLLAQRNFGLRSLGEVEAALAERGLALADGARQ
jgi:DNA-directed RNA polymerase alpha subunit